MKKILAISGFVILVAMAFIAGGVVGFGSYKGLPFDLYQQKAFGHIDPAKFKSLVDSGKYTLIDVRTQSEYAAGHLKDAKQEDYYQTRSFSEYLDKLDKNAAYLVYCRTGVRSAAVLKIMQDKGFTNVADLAGGYNAWIAYGLEVER